MKIILASSSPRRKELLSLMGLEFEVVKPENDEDMKQKIKFTKLSEILSEQKAKEVFDKTNGDRIVIGSDCMVFSKNKLLGKPQDDKAAFDMIKLISGSWHKVVTGLCVMVERNGEQKIYNTHDVTKVKFKKLNTEAINDYLSKNDHSDKAGAYAIQGKAGMYVEKINGNLSTVVGIPTHKLYDILKQENILK
ncbi:MAG: septum formation protein Maf [Clostridia bacterium]|nr:septum formation protein Maf [Clostridia bacterium]